VAAHVAAMAMVMATVKAIGQWYLGTRVHAAVHQAIPAADAQSFHTRFPTSSFLSLFF